jgi:hypothetical protein
MVLPVISLPRSLKLAIELGPFLREGGGEMVALVAINRAFADAELS